MAVNPGFQIEIPSGKRSDNKAIIILLGLTGAGKTTTLNFLFDRENMIKTESYCSATDKIMEYNAKVNVRGEEYDLQIIDTPGFGDTRQRPQLRDARFIATFNENLINHTDLKSCYPTTILLVTKYNDDRIEGEGSHFIQMLKAIDTMLANKRVIDKKAENCNLIIVLTHTMSEQKAELRMDPRPKIQLIECLVRTFTRIPTPIHVVMAENKPELYNLPKKADFYHLPNGQYYPYNLFLKIQSMCVKSFDVVGETIVREAFKNPREIKVELKKEIGLLSEDADIVKKTWRELQSAKFNIQSTEITMGIKKIWDKLDSPSKAPYPFALEILQDTFYKHKIYGTVDLPTKSDDMLKLLMDLPLSNAPVLKVLTGLGVVGPELPSSLCVGYFYNIFADSPLNCSPFDLSASGYTTLGFRAARGIQTETLGQHLVFSNAEYQSVGQYLQTRLSNLNVGNEFDFKQEKFSCQPQRGYNIVPLRTYVKQLSGISEKRLYKIYLTHPALSNAFKEAVSALPDTFREQEAEKWHAFFHAHGTHVVESLYAGGSVEVLATKRPSGKVTQPETVLRLIATILSNVGTNQPMNLEALADDWDFSLSFRGGDRNIVLPTIDSIFSFAGVKSYKAWEKSIYTHPVMLHSDIGLECVSEFLKETNPSIAKEIRRAITKLFCNPEEVVEVAVKDEPAIPLPKPTPAPRPDKNIPPPRINVPEPKPVPIHFQHDPKKIKGSWNWNWNFKNMFKKTNC